MKGSKGWQTRYVYKGLPKYVHPYNNRHKGYAYWRVAKKENGKVITYGYFKSLEQAETLALLIEEI